MDFPTNRVMLFAGGGLFVASSSNEISVIKYNDDSLLNIKHGKAGALVSGQFFGPDGDIIAVLEDNKMILNPDNIFRVSKDKHSLVVYDKRNRKVIDIRYLNRNAFSFSGLLRLPDGRVLEVTDQSMILGNLTIVVRVSLDSKAAIVVAGPK